MSKLAEAEAASVATRLEPAWSAARLEHNLKAVHARNLQAKRRRKIAAISAATLIAAAACFVLVTRLWSTTGVESAAATAQVLNRTQFADGSVAELVRAPGALALVSASERAVEMRLDGGEARFEVTPNPERRFVVHAGEITVRVLGTSFVVERQGARVRVAVDRGLVEVEWAETVTRLSAGESRWFPGEALPATEGLADLDSPALEAAAPALSAAPPARSAMRERFVQHALRGEYQAAYQIMSESPGAIGNSAEDLLLAADSARLSNHPEQAVVYLRRITREHAKDSRAPLAAFTLGRVLMSQLGRPAEAEGAFALVRKLTPTGALAEDALARQAEALWRAGNRERARVLAGEYRSRHPSGKHLSSLQKLGMLD